MKKVRGGQLELNCSILTYLYAVSRNLWLNRLRAQKKIVDIDERIDSVVIPAESLEVLDVNDRQKTILGLLKRLGEDCQKVLTHYYYDRLRMREIAERMEWQMIK